MAKTAVWRWQERFMRAGVDGLLRDKTRPARILPLSTGIIERVVQLTLSGPPEETTHWTALAMARAIGISVSSVQPIWRSRGLKPHWMRQFKLSNDPRFAGQGAQHRRPLRRSTAYAVVLPIDEESRIQGLDRTQPGLPLKRGRYGTMTHDYKRSGTTTLFAALNVLDGHVIGRCMQRYRHQEFIRSLNAVEARVLAGKLVYAIVDNHAAHKHPKVIQRLARHLRWTLHFTPTSASPINAVERFFAKLAKRHLERGVFHSPVSLQVTISRFVAEANAIPTPLHWTKDPDAIIAAVRRGHQALESLH